MDDTSEDTATGFDVNWTLGLLSMSTLEDRVKKRYMYQNIVELGVVWLSKATQKTLVCVCLFKR